MVIEHLAALKPVRTKVPPALARLLVSDRRHLVPVVMCEKGLGMWDMVWAYMHPKLAQEHPEMRPSKRIVPATVLYNDADRREFIGAGAAAGLAVSKAPLRFPFPPFPQAPATSYCYLEP